MADEWWNSSARTGDAAACSLAEVADESAVSSTPMGFQPGLPDGAAAAAAASPSSSSFLLADDQHMDYWTQDFMGGRASATEATTSFNTLLQLQGDGASHRLLLDDQAAAASRHLVPGLYGDGALAAAAQAVSPYTADSLQYGGDMALAAATSTSTKIPFSQLLLNSSAAPPPSPASSQQFPGSFLGSSGLFRQAMEPPELLLRALEPKFLKDACSPATTSAPGSPAAAKKPRIEAPSPLPTFKVRKEKLGDRITALQQLVSPFGKTDTASVLHEAIEYIKFLHDQVASLSSPYLRCGRPMQLQNQKGSHKAKDSGEAKPDLRSRGLCLVPVASTYTVASETTPEFWHPTFGGTFR